MTDQSNSSEAQDHLVALVTCPQDKARYLAEFLVHEKLVACVNIVPTVTSVYVWDGKVCGDDESLLIIKTCESVWQRLTERLAEVHPYDVPEIIALKISNGYEPYLRWVSSCVAGDKKIST